MHFNSTTRANRIYIRMEEVAFVPKALASENVKYYMAVWRVQYVVPYTTSGGQSILCATLCSVCVCVHESRKHRYPTVISFVGLFIHIRHNGVHGVQWCTSRDAVRLR